MKKDIHPKTQMVDVVCGCGSTFKALSVRKSVKVEICSACHPFFTGKKRMVDTAGRVERFMQRAKKSGAGYGKKTKPVEKTSKRVVAKD